MKNVLILYPNYKLLVLVIVISIHPEVYMIVYRKDSLFIC